MDELFEAGGRDSLEYCFATCYLWRQAFGFRAARLGDRLIVQSGERHRTSYLFPAGSGPIEPAIDALIERAGGLGAPLKLTAVLPHQRAMLEAAYPGAFAFEPTRADFDYVYEAEKLATLAGRKLSKKRNHIHQFVALYPDWQYEPLTMDNLGEARRMNQIWYTQPECEMKGDLLDEATAINQAFEHFGPLNLMGGLLRVGGRAVAFTMGQELRPDMVLVHFEKALYEVTGAYTMINREFVRNACQGYRYVNREEDAGDAGLRQAKLSYQPAMLIEKFTATYTAEGA
ncbi:MAG: DUF2156 domain-containing protein [Clostridiales bacterium]|nr:DUF2156 domain-containing protein [Clostridiales bacterium]